MSAAAEVHEAEDVVTKDSGDENLGDPKPGAVQDRTELRIRAEQHVQMLGTPQIDARWPIEARRTFHELQVNQAELEMQNEELRATQQQLEASNARYFALYDLAPVGYITLSDDGHIVEANLTAAVALGIDRGSLPGQLFSRFILRDDHKVYHEHFLSLFTNSNPQNCELRLKKRDNTWFWVRLETILGAGEAGRLVWRVVVSDITERKKAEESLRKALQQLEFITEHMEAGVARCDRDLRYLWVSRSLANWLGRSPEEIAGRKIVDVIGPRAFESLLPHMQKVLSGEREEYEAQGNYRGVGMRWIHAVYVPTWGQDRAVDGWIAVVKDITAERTAQEQRIASQKLESVGTLARGIAHDFNNLLGSVLAQADLALEEYREGSSPEEELRCIRDVAVQGSEIVRQLMTFAGKERESAELIDVSRIVREMVQLLRVSISKHAALETDLGHNLAPIWGGAGQIQQIVMNLVTNASEALGDRDGVIRLTIRQVKVDRAVAVSSGVAEGDYVQLEVADTGQGMSSETQARVFDPFFTTKAVGRGLGLAVVQGIVRALGGSIHIQSEPGEGTTVQTLFPCAGAVSEATQTPAHA